MSARPPHNGGKPRTVQLAESTFARPAQPLPVVTIASDGVYLDDRPLVASWPADKCDRFGKKLAPRDQPSVAKEQLILPLSNFAPASPEAERLGLLILHDASRWTLSTLERGSRDGDSGFSARIDKRAPFDLVRRVMNSIWFNRKTEVLVLNGAQEMALAPGWKFPGFDDQDFSRGCGDGLGEIIEVNPRGFSIQISTWLPSALSVVGDRPQDYDLAHACALEAEGDVPDHILRGAVHQAPLPRRCQTYPRVRLTASGRTPWSRIVAMYTQLHRIGAPPFDIAWFLRLKRHAEVAGKVESERCGILVASSGQIRWEAGPGIPPEWCNVGQSMGGLEGPYPGHFVDSRIFGLEGPYPGHFLDSSTSKLEGPCHFVCVESSVADRIKKIRDALSR